MQAVQAQKKKRKVKCVLILQSPLACVIFNDVVTMRIVKLRFLKF